MEDPDPVATADLGHGRGAGEDQPLTCVAGVLRAPVLVSQFEPVLYSAYLSCFVLDRNRRLKRRRD